MTAIYRLKSLELPGSHPLHVGRFYPHIERRHHQLMQDRQDLILYLANLHVQATATPHPRGFCQIPLRLMTLRNWVYDYKVAFDYFFEIVQPGYSFGEVHAVSIVVPKPITLPNLKLTYAPPTKPRTGVTSMVKVNQNAKEVISSRLTASNRLDLQAPVDWLLNLPSNEVTFYFSPAGKLQLRDTSTWPIAAVETWPSWLREALFGPGVDIEVAYTQFLLEHVQRLYAGQSRLLRLLFPDLLRSLEDKQAWRQEICNDVFGLECTDDNLALVKKICMSLANGSRISPALMLSGVSTVRDAILPKIADRSTSHLTKIGKRLLQLSKQYSAARRIVCAREMELNPTKGNQKQVFLSYFEWERKARYKIWEEIGRRGIMVHDGIDGVPSEYLQDVPGLIKKLNLRLS